MVAGPECGQHPHISDSGLLPSAWPWYHDCMSNTSAAWRLPRSFRIDPSWFDHPSAIHGKEHTLRVMILADRLFARAAEEGLPVTEGLYRNLMTAALIHDLARKCDGLCHEHGAWARQSKRHIAETHFLGFRLPDDEWDEIGRAVEAHARHDPARPWPRGSLTALLKDADGLDRVRLRTPPDPAYFRHSFTASYLDLAHELLARDVEEMEGEFFGESHLRTG